MLVAILAGLAPLAEIASLANAGTLTAFAAVSLCLLVMRRREPDRQRLFRTPLAWIVGPAAILGCGYLFWNLQAKTQALLRGLEPPRPRLLLRLARRPGSRGHRLRLVVRHRSCSRRRTASAASRPASE